MCGVNKVKRFLKFAVLAVMLGAAAPAPRTIVNDAAALRRLQANSGMTLQWIGFQTQRRGHVRVRTNDGLITLTGSHRLPGSPGEVTLDGYVASIDQRAFTFVGRVVIRDTPDIGRECVRDGRMTFRITGKRRYWRMQEMEKCDGLTDYVDIYL